MAQDIMIAGSTYNDVPAVQFPMQGGGTASFVDPEDITEIDLASGQELTVTGDATEAILYATAKDPVGGTTSTKKIMEDGYFVESGSSNFKEWDITLTSDVTGEQVIISNDTWILAHYNDSKLVITLYSTQDLRASSTKRYVSFCSRGNRKLASYTLSSGNSYSIYGSYVMVSTTSGYTSVIVNSVYGGGLANGNLSVSQTGNLTIKGTSTASQPSFAAGTYHIVATIA